MQSSNWARFWQSERHAFDEVMRLATRFFAKRFCETFSVLPGVHVFDYGCGPGFLADVLVPRQVIFTGADINAFFIDTCKAQHPEGNFFTISTQVGNNIDLLRQNLVQPADHIILLSISQYLSAPSELEQIVGSLKQHLSKGGNIIVADVVDEDTRSYRDALSLLSHAAAQGKLGSFLRFMRYVLGSEYARVAKSNRLLHIPESFMNDMARRLGLSCRQVKGMTFHPTRKNYILQRQG